MKNLQKAGGISAIISAASYVFAIGLYMSLMMPMADPNLGLQDYMAFLESHKPLAFAWNFAMYILHGTSLVVLVLALRERIKDSSPRLGAVASAFGLIWAAFVLLSGFINLWGTEALIALYRKSQAQAESFKNALTIITMGIDSSDRLLGSLWVGLVSLGAIGHGTMPKALKALGLAIGAASLVLGLAMPVNDSTASLLFGLGAIVWWLALGIHMLGKPALEAAPAS